MENLQIQQTILNLLNVSQREYKKYIYEKYLNTEAIPLFMREFYSESPSWFTNADIDSMENTIHWSTIDDQKKRIILDDDIDNYFDSDDNFSEYSYDSSRSSKSYRSDSSNISDISKLSNMSSNSQ